MTLLQRYLYAVQNAIPKSRPAEDIVAEIGDDLQSKIDERATDLGRPMTEDEQVALLKAYGHPRAVASRYGGVQYLIGPDLLPFYWSTLIVVSIVVTTIELLIGAVSSLVLHDGIHFFAALSAAWNSMIWVFGLVTIIFALGERAPQSQGSGFNAMVSRWDPRRLPAPGALPAARRSSALAEFIANVLALLALLDASGPHRLPLDGMVANALLDMHATLTTAWHPVHIALIAGAGLIACSSISVFLKPQLSVLHEWVRAGSSAIVVVGLIMTLQAGPWILPSSSGLNTAALYTLAAALVVMAVQIAASARALRRSLTPKIYNDMVI